MFGSVNDHQYPEDESGNSESKYQNVPKKMISIMKKEFLFPLWSNTPLLAVKTQGELKIPSRNTQKCKKVFLVRRKCSIFLRIAVMPRSLLRSERSERWDRRFLGISLLSLILLGAFLFLSSCSTSEETAGDARIEETIPETIQPVPAINSTANADETLETVTPEEPEGLCTPDWICLGSSRKVYQDKDCYFTEEENCRFGCVNGTCRSAEEAEAAASEMEQQAAEETTVGAAEDGQGLAMGKVDVVEIGGIQYNISLYNIEAERVIIEVNGARSEWMNKSANHTFSSGVTITITEILFQSYAGGIRRVVYEAE